MIQQACSDTFGSNQIICQYLRIKTISRDHSLSGRQVAAARTLLGLSQGELAAAARISIPTLKRMEGSGGAAAGLVNNVGAVRAALEAAGVEFIPENGGGAGVRLRKRGASPDHPKPTGPATDVVEQLDKAISTDRTKRKGAGSADA